MPLAPRSRPTVAVLAYEGMSPFETGIVTEVFGLPRPELDLPWYELTVCAERPGPVRIVGDATLETRHGLDVLASAHTVIVPGVPDVRAKCSPKLVAALRLAHSRGARMVSICSGAFALAAAGLLDHRRAATHWQYADLLRRRFPLVRVDADVLYVDDGDVLTSAGSAAGLDLCLHLVRRDHGADVANLVARRLVIAPHREGGQAQFIEAPVPHDPGDDRVARTMTWALENLPLHPGHAHLTGGLPAGVRHGPGLADPAGSPAGGPPRVHGGPPDRHVLATTAPTRCAGTSASESNCIE